MSRELIEVCRVDELEPGSVRRIEPPDHPAIAVYNVDGELHATADRCTHAKASLCDGDVEGDEVVCPVHFGRFHIPTGKALAFPATSDLVVFPVVVRDGAVLVDVPTNLDDRGVDL